MSDAGEGSVWAVVAAAGESRRMGLPEGESKQFLLLGGEPVLCHSVRRLLSIPAVAGVVVVLHPSHTVRFARESLRLEEDKPILIAEGGRERCDSIRAGLLHVPAETAVIAVHDGARPLFSKHVFDDCLALLSGSDAVDGAIPACPVADTLKRADDLGAVVETVERGGLWMVQTPQLFRAEVLRAAYARPDVSGATDDAALLEREGRRVVVVPSTPGNVKITTPGDLPLAGAVLSWEVEADV